MEYRSLLPACLLALFLVANAATVSSAKDSLPKGVVKEKPSSGLSVETDEGFMVPYAERIPGTDIEFQMIPVPGGVVEVGLGRDAHSDDAEYPTSTPLRVRVEPRWVGAHEVTWDEYWQFMSLDRSFSQIKQLRSLVARSANKGEPVAPLLKKFDRLWRAIEATPSHVDGVTSPTPLYDPSATYESGEEPELPAVTMSPYAAKQYTKWLSAITGVEYRLPSEAEWEHAARAGGAGPFGAGAEGAEITADSLSDYAWLLDNSDYVAHDVGEKTPNAWGLYDVLGNAAEWVLDEYRTEPQEQADDESVAWDAAVWPEPSTSRIAKGGFYAAEAADCRVASQLPSDDEEWKLSDPNYPKSPWWFTEWPATGIGFRVVRPLEAMDDKLKQRVWEIDHEQIQADVDARLQEGRGKMQRVDRQLPDVLKELDEPEIKKLLN